MKQVATRLAVLMSLLCAGAAAAQTARPDFSGGWVVKAGTKTLTINQTTTQITVTEDGLPLVFTFDGKPTERTAAMHMFRTTAKWNGQKLELNTSTEGDNPFTRDDVYSMTSDGKILARSSTFKGNGDPVVSKTEYVKGPVKGGM